MWEKNPYPGNSPVVQWLGLHILTAEDPGSAPGQGARIPQDAQRSQNKNEFISLP